jgi:hypothetical protein
MSHHVFKPARLTRGQQIAVVRKPTMDRRSFEAARRKTDSGSSLAQHRRRGARRSASR